MNELAAAMIPPPMVTLPRGREESERASAPARSQLLLLLLLLLLTSSVPAGGSAERSVSKAAHSGSAPHTPTALPARPPIGIRSLLTVGSYIWE
eukprot:scaffold1187_cov374-Prasinococcus_capsulatus_cf.AAC.14